MFSDQGYLVNGRLEVSGAPEPWRQTVEEKKREDVGKTNSGTIVLNKNRCRAPR